MTASRMRAPARRGSPRRPAVPGERARAAATSALCAFAATMARGDAVAAAAALTTARRSGSTRVAAEETALMLMLYAGFPGALEGLRVLNTTWPGVARRTREGTPATWRRRGLALWARVYGDAIGRLLPAVRALHPDLETWMVEHGYGRVLARPGLGARERELVTVSALAALGWERQLVSHVLGALRVGAGPALVREALAIGARAGGSRERATASRVMERVIVAGRRAVRH